MKILCETKGQFMLTDHGQTVEADRPGVVVNTAFIANRVAVNQVAILGELTDAATDDEFLKYFKESKGDQALAVESFLAAFGVEAMTKKADKKPKAPAVA